jgi:hypothetical protein
VKRFHFLTIGRLLLMLLLLGHAAVPRSIWACACGCGIFEIGTSSMFPTHPGGMIWTEYDYQDQNRNWAGSSPSSAGNNSDQKILTNFFQIGAQYMFNRQWGIMGDLPYWDRYFKTADDNGNVGSFTHNAIGDIRIRGIYSGFSDDMSTGLTFGLKLPTGDYTYPNFDPDVEIGSGSTDLLVGAYQFGQITHSRWDWFSNANTDLPVLHDSGYLPGSEIDAAAGVYYDGWKIGAVKVAPLGQIVGSHRWSDSGTLADAPNSGYSRVLLAPGVEFDTARIRVYADVGFPVYQYTTGNQLIASELFKLNIGYHF